MTALSDTDGRQYAAEGSILVGAAAPWLAADIVQAFDAQVAARPLAQAVLCGDASLSYADLDQSARLLAADLLAHGAGQAEIVGVDLARGPDWIVALLAILRAGACYLPLNPKDPEARRQTLIEDARPCLLVRKSGVFGPFQLVPTGLSGALPVASAAPADRAAYVMYTSGSTGTPKGVIVSHGNVLRLVGAGNPVPLGPQTRILQTGAPTFDAVTYEIWGTLLNGGCIILPPDAAILSAAALGAEIARTEATTMWLTSPLFSLLAADDPAIFAPLKHLIVGGDVVVRHHVDAVHARCPGLTIVNGYGPTENTTFSTMHCIRRDDGAQAIPIGRPIARSTAYVLDAERRPVERGARGELYVGGDGVALGYLNRPDQTQASFLPDPFRGEGRMYRTGDMAMVREDGEIVFLGREDSQIKLRGFRIELGEIEDCLRAHPGVSDAVVIFDRTHAGGPRLVGYAAADETVSDLDLRDHLGRHLPPHMIPRFIVPLDSLPLTSHGKVARHALPAPEEFAYLGAGYAPPETATELAVASLMAEVTGAATIGLDDSFYDLGLDSLSAARLAVAIGKTIGVMVQPSTVLMHPTLRALSREIDGKGQPIPPQGHEVGPEAAIRLAHPSRLGLTRQQRPIYTEQIKAPDTVRYNVPVLLDLPVDVDLDRLEKALNAVVAARDILRIAMPLADPPCQVVMPVRPVTLPRFESPADPAALIRPFDLETGPLWRASLHREKGRWQLFLDLHHLIVDGHTLALLVGDLDRAYAGHPCPGDAPRLADVLHWETEGDGAARRAAQRVYWASRSWPVVRPETLPLDYPRKSDRSRESRTLRFALPPPLVQQLREKAARLQMTLFEILAGAYGMLLSRVTGEPAVTFGIPAHARHETGFDQVGGMLANTVCVGLDIAPGQPLASCLKAAGETLRQSLQNQCFTFGDLVEMTGAAADPARNPLFDTLFAFQSLASLSVEFLGQPTLLRPIPPGEAMFDLNLQLYQTAEAIEADWEFDASLFTDATVELLRDLYLGLLTQLCQAPEGLTVGDVLHTKSAETAPVPVLEFDF